MNQIPKRSLLFLVTGVVLVFGCKREQRGFRVEPPSTATLPMVPVTDFHAGGFPTNAAIKNDFEQNSYAISQGQHLYNYFNCVGCHAHGGGDKGPPLMDNKWIYGSNPEQVFASIIQGRPNGMPSFRGRITDAQVWEIVAYVRSLSGQVSKQAAPGRDEHMQTAQAPNSVSSEAPRNAVPPK